MCTQFKLIKKERSNIFPNPTTDPQSQEEGAKNICYVVEEGIGKCFFKNSVTTAILEILFIQAKESSQAHTFLYFDTEWNGGKVEAIKNKYFTIIDRVFGKHSLSQLDNFYFGDMIWIGSSSSKTVTVGHSSDGHSSELSNGKNWKNAETVQLEDYVPIGKGINVIEADDVKTYEKNFECYGSKLKQVLFSECPYFYILAIPVALSNKNEAHQEKIGAVFLHVGANEKIEPKKLLNVYQKVILYWHYNLTGEVLEVRQREREEAGNRERQAQERAMLYDQIKDPVEKLTSLLQDASEPLTQLLAITSPIEQLCFEGAGLSEFFESGDEIELEPNITIQPAHNFNTSEKNKFVDLISAIMLKALGKSDNYQKPLWEDLQEHLQQHPLGEKIKEVLPILDKSEKDAKDNINGDLENTFNIIKKWFNKSYKRVERDLPYSLMKIAMATITESIEIDTKYEDELRVASSRPIDTLYALNSLHQQYEIQCCKCKQQVVNGKNCHTIKLTVKNPHEMTSDDAVALRKSFELESKQGYQLRPRGDSTLALYQLFGPTDDLQLCNTTFTLRVDEHVFSLEYKNDNIIKITSIWPLTLGI